MARGRMLSKDISLDEKVDALSNDTTRLLFTWLIPHLDREGRMYGDAQVFKSIVAPRRNYSMKTVEKSLVEMEKLGLIIRYSFNGNTYLEAPNFEKHQPGLQKEKEAKSKLPSRNGKTSKPTPDLSKSKAQPTLTEGEGEVEVEENKSVAQHTSKVSNNPYIKKMQIHFGFPEKTSKDPVPNPAKEAKFIKKMLDRGFAEEAIFECWEGKVDDRGEFVSMQWINEDIGKKGGQHGTHKGSDRTIRKDRVYTKPDDIRHDED